MFEELKKYIVKPPLYTPSTNSLWDDEHVSKNMLKAHLNPDLEAATRKHDFIDKSVKWITEITPPIQYKTLLDLGCGPGLYAEQFSDAGYSVTGVDFSKRSIAYAKEQTIRNNSNITYHYKNYLELDYMEQYDVITLIYCDYGALSITDRLVLLNKIYQALKPNGKFILDVFTPIMRNEECTTWKYYEKGGFFNSQAHICLDSIYQYDDEDNTELRQTIVITEKNISCYNVWDHFFTKDILVSEIQPVGFASFELYDDIAGKEYTGRGDTICAIFTK